MRIHIIGGPGSGKTHPAEKLSKELGIQHYGLDDIQWDNDSDSYGIKRAPDERDRLLTAVLNQADWVIGGVYYAWCQQCFSDADIIYILSVPRFKYKYRIIRRFVRRKLGLEQGKKGTLMSLLQLLKWADKYQKMNLVEIRKLLIPYSDKVIE